MFNIIIIFILALFVGNGESEISAPASASPTQFNYAVLNEDCEPTPVETGAIFSEISFSRKTAFEKEAKQKTSCIVGGSSLQAISVVYDI